jgi:hypothetical protein
MQNSVTIMNMSIDTRKKNLSPYLAIIPIFLGIFLSPMVYSQETTDAPALTGDPESGDTIILPLDETIIEIVPTETPSLDEDVSVMVDETPVLVGDPELGDIIIPSLDTPITEGETPSLDEDVSVMVDETPVLVGDPELGDTITVPLDEIILEILPEEIIPVEIPYEEPDTEIYLTSEDIQAHLDFVNSLPKVSAEQTVRDVSQQEFSPCTLDTPTLDVTENSEAFVDFDTSSLSNNHTFNLGGDLLGIHMSITNSQGLNSLFNTDQASLVVDTESYTQKGVFSIPLITTDKVLEQKTLCQITLVSQ